MRNFLCVHLLLFTLAQAETLLPSVNVNPCAPGNIAAKDEGFPIGLAYWPGGTVEDWGNSSAGLNPCQPMPATIDPAVAEAYSSKTLVAAFNFKVDTIALMQTSSAEEKQLFDAATPAVLSVVAFAGNIRSEARYIWSNDATITEGTGVLDTLSLIAEFEDGVLTYLRWQEFPCGASCTAASCLKTGIVYAGVPTRACAGFTMQTCMTTAGVTTEEVSNRCHTIIQVGSSGTDESHVVLNTGIQLQNLQQFALTGLYESIASGVGSVGETVGGLFGGT